MSLIMWGILILVPLGAWYFDAWEIAYFIGFIFAVEAFFNARWNHEILNRIQAVLILRGGAELGDFGDSPIGDLVKQRKERDKDILTALEEAAKREDETEEKP